MSKNHHHRRSQMTRPGIKNGSQNGSKKGSKMVPKMAPTWLQNGPVWGWIKKVWAASNRGKFSSDFGCHLGPLLGVQNQARNAPRPTRRPISASWRVFGTVPEGVWEVIWGGFGRVGRRDPQKRPKFIQTTFFFELFLHAFSYRSRVGSSRFGARRRTITTLKYA